MKSVVIIGSGVGGSALAALLAQEGYAVTVLERNAFLGGRAASYQRDGFTCDMGVHYVGRGAAGPHGEVARRTGADLTFLKVSPFMRVSDGVRKVDLPLDFTRLVPMFKLARVFGVPPRKWIGTLAAILKLKSLKSEDQAAAYDELPLKDFLLPYCDDPAFFFIMDMVAALLFVTAVSETSTGEFMHSFSTWARLASSSYPKGGFKRIAESFLEAAQRKGAQVLTHTSVTAIRVENGRATGVETDRGFFPADIVVSNAGIENTVNLAGREPFGAAYAARVAGFKYSAGAVTLKYGLDYAPMDIPILLQHHPGTQAENYMARIARGEVPEVPPMFMVSPTVVDPSLAPPGKHLLLAATVLPPDLSANNVADRLLDGMEKEIPRIFPGIEKHILWKHKTGLSFIDAMSHRGRADCIGLAQTHYQCGKNKPDPKTPIQNLWLVGCDAGGRGIGTEQASDSALKVFERIKEEG